MCRTLTRAMAIIIVVDAVMISESASRKMKMWTCRDEDASDGDERMK
jgi:hypothetical protein